MRHEWRDARTRREFLLEPDGSLYEVPDIGESPQTGEIPKFVAIEMFRLAERERLLLERLGEVADGLGYDRSVLDAPCNVLGHVVRDMAINLNSSLEREGEIAERARKLRDALLKAAVRIGAIEDGAEGPDELQEEIEALLIEG